MSDRQLRSGITNPRTGNKRLLSFDGLPPSGNSKPKKRRKVEYRCVRCGQNKPSRSFPRTNPTTRCDHDINTCKECLQAWVDTQIRDDLLVAGVRDHISYRLRCPECPELIQAADIRAIATPRMYRMFALSVRSRTAGPHTRWLWCQNSGCGDGGIAWPRTGQVLKYCRRCNFPSCLSCSQGHRGETCAAYHARIQNPVEGEDESLELIGQLTRPCPRCGLRIEKNGGCPHMHCKYFPISHWLILTIQVQIATMIGDGSNWVLQITNDNSTDSLLYLSCTKRHRGTK